MSLLTSLIEKKTFISLVSRYCRYTFNSQEIAKDCYPYYLFNLPFQTINVCSCLLCLLFVFSNYELNDCDTYQVVSVAQTPSFIAWTFIWIFLPNRNVLMSCLCSRYFKLSFLQKEEMENTPFNSAWKAMEFPGIFTSFLPHSSQKTWSRVARSIY